MHTRGLIHIHYPCIYTVFGRSFVIPMLWDHRLSCLCAMSCPICLSVTLVYCGQTVGLIKMNLGMEVGLGPGHILLDGDPVSPEKGHNPQFLGHRLGDDLIDLLFEVVSVRTSVCTSTKSFFDFHVIWCVGRP